MKYYILCNGRPLPDMNGILEFNSRDEAGEFIADLDGENTVPLQVVNEKHILVRLAKGEI